MRRDTIYISFSFGLHPSFWARITCFSLSLFKLFYVDSLLLVQVKHKRMLYRFLS